MKLKTMDLPPLRLRRFHSQQIPQLVEELLVQGQVSYQRNLKKRVMHWKSHILKNKNRPVVGGSSYNLVCDVRIK